MLCALVYLRISSRGRWEEGGEEGEGGGWRRMGGELALHRETQRTSPRKLPCGEGKTEAGSVHSLVSSRRRRGKRASADSRSSLHGPFLPSDDTEGTVPVSRRSTRGSLISRMSRCHWSLGRVRSAPAWLLSRPLRPGCSLLDCWTPRGPALEKAVEGVLRFPGTRGWRRPCVLVCRGAAARREVMETFNFHHSRPSELCFKSL